MFAHLRTCVALAAAVAAIGVPPAVTPPSRAAPSSFLRYNLSYTTLMPLEYGWEEQLFVAALAGLYNRHAPSLLVQLSATDASWLELARARGGWLESSSIVDVPDLPSLVTNFAPLGVVLYDPAVPATSMLATTIAGIDALLPVAYKPGDAASLYARLVAGGPRLRVRRSLVGAFNASGPARSAKAAAYAFAVDLLMPDVDGRFLAYTGDAFCSGPAHAGDAGAYDKIEIANVDWTVSRGGFIFDLGVWADEAPVDDPAQPLGADAAAMRAVLRAATARATSADAAQPFVHISGFVPWWCKYVDGNSAHKHGGVQAEWATSLVASSFNAFIDADACCIGNLAGASFWAHYPLSERYVVRAPPMRADLVADGLLTPEGTITPSISLLYFFYAGDFDSAAWLASQLPPRWADAARGSVPIAWPIDPELSLRFPPAFDLLLFGTGAAAPTRNDVLTAGDSGAGYLNPMALHGATRANESGLPDALGAWGSWNAAWNRQFGISFTGFVINGDAPAMDNETLAAYARFSGNGAAQGGGGAPTRLGGGGPGGGAPFVPQLDISPNATDAARAVAGRVPAAGAPLAGLMVRSVLTSPSYLRDVAASVRAATAGAAAVVDPLAFGYLMRLALGGNNDDRAAYVGDTLPGGAARGARVDFRATVRNDGWNVLNASYALSVTVTAVEVWADDAGAAATRIRAVADAATTTSSLATVAAAAASAIGDRGRWPAHARRAAIAGKRARAGRVCRVAVGAAAVFPFPSDIAPGASLDIPAAADLPAAARAAAASGACAVAGAAVTVAEVTYEVVAAGGARFADNGVLPWVSMVVLT